MSTGDRSADRDPLDLLAEEFVARYRRGSGRRWPSMSSGYPELAEQIEELFPALLDDGTDQAGGGQPGSRPARRSVPRAFLARADRTVRRFPDPARTRPGRDGRGLRGDPGIARPARRAQGLATARPARRDQLGRFRREARAAAGLHHTNIVPVFAVGEQDGVPYYAMQFIRGQGSTRSSTSSCGCGIAVRWPATSLRPDGTASRSGKSWQQDAAGAWSTGPRSRHRDNRAGLLSGRFAVRFRAEAGSPESGTTTMRDPTRRSTPRPPALGDRDRARWLRCRRSSRA